jgi:hypothetical protein
LGWPAHGTSVSKEQKEIVHILHQDDLVGAGFYHRLRQGLESRPTVGAAFCRHAFIDSNGRQTMISEAELEHPGVLRKFQTRLAQKARIQCAAIVVRKSTYQQVGGFDPRFAYVLDWDMWLRISLVTEIWYEPEVLASYRIHTSAMTGHLQRTGDDVRDIGKFLGIAETYFPGTQGRQLTSVARKIYAKRAISHARSFLRIGDTTAAANQLREAWRLSKSPGLVSATFNYYVRLLMHHFGVRPLRTSQ